jgi:hypothetical protein
MSQAEMMKKWEESLRLGQHHKDLAYTVGTWDGVIEFPPMPGMPAMPPSKVEGTGAWLIEGRWASFRVKGTLMGKPYEGFGISGFDATKKKHVASWVDNGNTAMHYYEGTVVDPTGAVVALYGTLDEFLTGEHDKPVRYTRRKVSDDKFVLEIWDLGIGELGQVVMRQTFTRRK